MGIRWIVGPVQQQRAGAYGAVVGRGGGVPHGVQRLRTDQQQHLGGTTVVLRRCVGADPMENQSNVLALFIDGNASMGVGADPGTWERGDPRALGPWGNRHVNAAGQEMCECLKVVGLAAARTFFRAKGGCYDTWMHPRLRRGYSLDQIFVRRSQIGRVREACTCGAVAVASDQVPTFLELNVGRMQRRQKAENQTKPSNIAARCSS